METIKYESVTALWFDNSSREADSSATLSNQTGSPVSAEWDIIHAVIPPYIFTLSLLGLLFNSFVLGVFLIHKDKLTVAEIYLSNLVLADFILMCSLPFWAMYILNNFDWPYGNLLCKLVNSVIIINFYTSIFTLVMISVDRYLALVKPMKARRLRRTLYAKVICFILWMLALLLSTPTIVHRQVKFIDEYKTMSCILDYSHDSSWKLAHQILMNVVGFLLPVLVIAFSSGNIIKALGKRKETVGFHSANDTKATVLVCAVILLFLLCWGPYQVFTFLDTLSDIHMLDDELWYNTLDIGGQFSVYLAFLNSVLNPLLYVISGQYFTKKVSAICRRTAYHRRGSDMTTYQRSVVSTYINRIEQIKTVVIFNA